MENTVVITSIYQEFWGTEHFRKSVERVGYPLHNAFKGQHYIGNGDVIRQIYEALVELKDQYKYAIYADGADSLFVKQLDMNRVGDQVVYSTEKAIWPPVESLKKQWEYYYKGVDIKSPWMYLNGGGYCGNIDLLIKYFEHYGLNKLTPDANGQWQQAEAFLKAYSDEFPITLDTQCDLFQTTGFEDPGDFHIVDLQDIPGGNSYSKAVINTFTGSTPSILHGNGRTNMDKYYNMFN